MKLPTIALVMYIFGTGQALCDPCPKSVMEGTLRIRFPNERIWDMRASVNGTISLSRHDSQIFGHSEVICKGGSFTATFTSMSDGSIYRCEGEYDDHDFLGSCMLDYDHGVRDIAGQFKG